MKKIIIKSGFGHEIGAAATAKLQGAKLVVSPNKSNQTDYYQEAANILRNISFFNDNIEVKPWGVTEEGWDFKSDLVSGQIKDEEQFWHEYAGVELSPTESTECLPTFNNISKCKEEGAVIIGFATGKTMSDGKCGVTASQQSLPFWVFASCKELSKKLERPVVFVDLQNFDKVKDLGYVASIKEYLENVYIIGESEHPELFGIRGVPHKMFYHLYRQLDLIISVAATQTWYGETMFANLPMINLFNTHTENWAAKEAAYQKRGRQYYCLGYNEETDLKEYAKQLETTILQVLKNI